MPVSKRRVRWRQEGLTVKGFFEATLADVTRLVLVRHARTAGNVEGRMCSRSEIGIDEVGRRQAELVARRLAEFDVSVLYSSPQLRARQTAEIIAARLGLEIVYRDELVEFDFGEISETTLEELKALNPARHAELCAWMEMGPEEGMCRPEIPGAETVEGFTERLTRFRDMVLDRHQGQVVAAVSHGATIKGFMTLFSGGDLRMRKRFYADNASLSVVDFYHRVPTIRTFNERCDLGDRLGYGRPLIV